jgi:hypothetical protein
MRKNCGILLWRVGAAKRENFNAPRRKEQRKQNREAMAECIPQPAASAMIAILRFSILEASLEE